MNASWIEWAFLALVIAVAFLLPVVVGKYIDMRVKLAMRDNECRQSRVACSMSLLVATQMRRSVTGRAFAIMPDGRVFALPGRKVAEAVVLGCEEAFFEVLTNRGRKGLDDQEIEQFISGQGMLWRGEMADVIVYFEGVYGKGLRDALGVDMREAAAFRAELQSVRAGIAAKAAKSGKEEMEVCDG